MHLQVKTITDPTKSSFRDSKDKDLRDIKDRKDLRDKGHEALTNKIEIYIL